MNDQKVAMEHIVKSFGGTRALKDVSFAIAPAEIHALVGENGAGKSTLMKILSGAYSKDEGRIALNGAEVTITSPIVSRKLGIGVIYQEFALANDLTVAENIFLGHLSSGGLIRWRRLYENAARIISDLLFTIDPRKEVRALSVAHRQVVEIAKVLSENVDVLVLDEPSTVLAPHEVDKLFGILASLKAQGVSIVYISHRLEEVLRISDRVSVMKDGKMVKTLRTADTSVEEVISLMIGRKLSALFPPKDRKIEDSVVLEVRDLNSRPLLKNINFTVRKGEILGFAGLVGSGRTETMKAIFGLDRLSRCELVINGRPIRNSSAGAAVRNGIGYVPEDRKEEGIVLTESVGVNITFPILRRLTSFLGFVRRRKERQICTALVDRLAIRTPSLSAETWQLSGGNQQKVVLARWFAAECELLILDEPTRGVDVGAKVDIYELISEIAASGVGVIFVSSEMMEIIGLCDRVAVMREGTISAFLEGDEITEDNIMRNAIPVSEGS